MSGDAMRGTPIGAGSAAPVLVQVVRGAIVEAHHRGDVVIVGDGGAVRAALGAPDRLISLRSAIKPFTAVAVLLAVEASGGEVSSETLALASASHAGSEEHVAVAEEMVRRYKLDVDLLVHGRPSPIRSGSRGTLLQHMCSGQHLSLLMLAKALGVDGRGYDGYEHPVQQRLRAIVGQLLGTDLGVAPWGMDGCAIPTYAVPLHVAAEGARRWANPDASGLSSELTDALRRVRAAAIAHPRLIAGGGFLDTDLIRGGDGVVVAKQGAEGLCLVGAPGIGIALHTDDGDAAARAGRVATVAALRAAGAAVASSTALDLHRTVQLPDPRGGSALAYAEATSAFDALRLS
ncbi:MAG: asparaginase [Candidatus Limnocylindrus sp.]|jgi:L-asparaginase II